MICNVIINLFRETIVAMAKQLLLLSLGTQHAMRMHHVVICPTHESQN